MGDKRSRHDDKSRKEDRQFARLTLDAVFHVEVPLALCESEFEHTSAQRLRAHSVEHAVETLGLLRHHFERVATRVAGASGAASDKLLILHAADEEALVVELVGVQALAVEHLEGDLALVALCGEEKRRVTAGKCSVHAKL